MKTTLLRTVTIFAISVYSLYAQSAETSDEVTLLRQEIQTQELVLQALKEKLARLKNQNVFEIAITPEGLSTDSNLIALKELEKTLKELPDDTKILIRAESTVSHQEVASVMELCAQAGLKNVAIATARAEQDRGGNG